MDKRLVPIGDLAGIDELAGSLGVKPNTIHVWIKRHGDFPQPVKRLAQGPLYLISEIRFWADNRSSASAAERQRA